MITITAEQHVVAGKEQEVEELMSELMDHIARTEPGCVRFDYVVDPADPGKRLVIECYRDEAALSQHLDSPYLAQFIPELLPALESPPSVTRHVDVFPPRTSPTFFHTGIVVPDLEQAVAYYHDSFGIAFTDPGVFHIPRLEDPDPHPWDLTAVLSRTEPPYLELIQAAGDGITGFDKCGQILYHGYWESDMAARWEWLTTDGPGVDAAFRMDEHTPPFSIITAPDPYGNRVEYVGTAAADPLTEWARTGVLPTGIGA